MREDNDLTQTAVAKYLRISQQYYSNIEKGERTISVDIICMLADYYKSFYWLFIKTEQT